MVSAGLNILKCLEILMRHTDKLTQGNWVNVKRLQKQAAPFQVLFVDCIIIIMIRVYLTAHSIAGSDQLKHDSSDST